MKKLLIPSGTRWENALPVGNGKSGAMVYGNVDIETVLLNECTVWSGSPDRNHMAIRFENRAGKFLRDGCEMN
jgi:hypothetical protein